MYANIFMIFLQKKIFYMANGLKKKIKNGFEELILFRIRIEK
jgi:hypothetical protein